MKEAKRTYSKGRLEREIFPQQKKKVVEVEAQQLVINNIPLSDYLKTDMEQIPKAFFVIISGGEVREKDYFRIISNQDKFSRIKLEFVADPLKLSPDGMYELAVYKKARYTTSQNVDAEPDKIYLISDVDHFISELIRIKPHCEKDGFNLIINNSCFEVWLYYAYKEEFPNFTKPDNPLIISRKFKGWLNTAIRGGVKPNRAILNIYPNIENAKRNYREDENGIPKLFSTNMYLLAEKLLPLIEPELSIIIAENKRVETDFRNRNNK